MELSGPWPVMLHFCLGPGGAKEAFVLDLCLSLSVLLNYCLLWPYAHKWGHRGKSPSYWGC